MTFQNETDFIGNLFFGQIKKLTFKKTQEVNKMSKYLSQTDLTQNQKGFNNSKPNLYSERLVISKLLPLININSSISHLNKEWILDTINNFFQEHNNFSNVLGFELTYEHQRVKGKNTKIVACLRSKEGFVFSNGEGVDEYEATKDLLENLELELIFLGNNYSDDTIQSFIGGGQYA